MGNNNICQQTCCNIQGNTGAQHEVYLEEKKQPEDKLQPILFQQGSNTGKQNIEEEEVKVTMKQASEKEVPTASSFRPLVEKSTLKASNIELSKMTVIGQSTALSVTNATQELAAPYKVIRMTATPAFSEIIRSHGRDLLSKYKDKQLAEGWKLHNKGFYYIELSVSCLAIFQSDKYYEGEYEQEEDTIFPNGRGVLLTQKGLYKGEFKRGKVHGEGKFIDASTKTEFSGNWSEGLLAHGTMKNADLEYEGPFRDGQAEGQGQLKITQNKTVYKGWFKEGLFSGDNETLQCNNYLYCGMFREGVKKGWGCLVSKEKVVPPKSKFSKREYYPAEVYDGKWENDVYSGGRKKMWTSQKGPSQGKSLTGKNR